MPPKVTKQADTLATGSTSAAKKRKRPAVDTKSESKSNDQEEEHDASDTEAVDPNTVRTASTKKKPTTAKTPVKQEKAKKTTTAKKSTATAAEKPAAVVNDDDSPSPSAPKRVRTAEAYTPLANLGQAALPMDIEVSNYKFGKDHRTTVQAKISSDKAFLVVGTDMITEGTYKDCQAVYIRPPKPFNWMGLPDNAKTRVFEFYFASKSCIDEPISIEGKRKNGGDIYAKEYSMVNGKPCKNRVALLAVSKAIYVETIIILHSKTLRLENATAALNFLGQLCTNSKEMLTSLHIAHFKKGEAKLAFAHLAQAKNIQTLKIEEGAHCGFEDGRKQLDAFYTETSQFFDHLTNARKVTDPNVTKSDTIRAVLQLGSKALNTGKGQPPPPAQYDDFMKALCNKAKSERWNMWACVCGSMVLPHSCREELASKHELTKQEKQAQRRKIQDCERCNNEMEHLTHSGAEMLTLIEEYERQNSPFSE